jgi:hypothetical protein
MKTTIKLIKTSACVILLSSFALTTVSDAKTTVKKKASAKVVKVINTVSPKVSENVLFNFYLPATFTPDNLLVSPAQIESAPSLVIEAPVTPPETLQTQVIETPQPAIPQPAIPQPVVPQPVVPQPVVPQPVITPTVIETPPPTVSTSSSNYAPNGLIWCSALGRLPALGESCQLPFATTDYSLPTSVVYDANTLSFTGVPSASNTKVNSSGNVVYTPTFAAGSPNAGPVSIATSGNCSLDGSNVVFSGSGSCSVTISQLGADSVTQYITPNVSATKES